MQPAPKSFKGVKFPVTDEEVQSWISKRRKNFPSSSRQLAPKAVKKEPKTKKRQASSLLSELIEKDARRDARVLLEVFRAFRRKFYS